MKGEKWTGKSVFTSWPLCLVPLVLLGSPQGLQVGVPGADSLFIRHAGSVRLSVGR